MKINQNRFGWFLVYWNHQISNVFTDLKNRTNFWNFEPYRVKKRTKTHWHSANWNLSPTNVIFWKISKYRIYLKIAFFKGFYSQKEWSYAKNAHDKKNSKYFELLRETGFMQKKSFLAILGPKTSYWKNPFFWFFLSKIEK